MIKRSFRQVGLAGFAALSLAVASVAYAAVEPAASTPPAAPTAPATPAAATPAPAAVEATVDPKAKAILDKYVEVTGGRAAYEKVTARETKATIEIVGQGITGVVVAKTVSPDKLMITTEITGIGIIEQGLVSDVAWTRSAMEGLRLLTPKELTQTKMQAAPDQATLNPEKLFSTIKYVGEETIDGKAVESLELDGPNGTITQSYEKATGYLIQMKATVSGPQGDVPMVSTMSDFKEVGGIKLPHSTIAVLGGVMTIKTIYTDFKINPEFPASTFAVPEDVQKLVSEKK